MEKTKSGQERNVNVYRHLITPGNTGKNLEWMLQLRAKSAEPRKTTQGPPGCYTRYEKELKKKPQLTKKRGDYSYFFRGPVARRPNSQGYAFGTSLRNYRKSTDCGRREAWTTLPSKERFNAKRRLSESVDFTCDGKDQKKKFDDTHTSRKTNQYRHLFKAGCDSPYLRWCATLRG